MEYTKEQIEEIAKDHNKINALLMTTDILKETLEEIKGGYLSFYTWLEERGYTRIGYDPKLVVTFYLENQKKGGQNNEKKIPRD